MNKKKVLILYDYFDPAYKAGGPIRSLVNLVKLLSSQFEISILTTNQDHDGSLLDVVPDQWISYGEKSSINYLSEKKRNYRSIKEAIKEVEPHTIYINGIYSLPFVVYPLRFLKERQDIKTIIAPRGMLQKESLSLKPIKKKGYLAFLKYFYLKQDICWHVTTDQEKDDLLKIFKATKSINLIGNVPSFNSVSFSNSPRNKQCTVFGTVALISPMKNVHLILESLKSIDRKIEYQLYGPIKDAGYWEACKRIIEQMPQHISVTYQGELLPDKVPDVIAAFDFYIQPSRSENFGHSIFEAFNQGVPVIISDQTPWQHLAVKNAGWDVDVKSEKSLVSAIEQALKLDEAAYTAYRQGARKVAEEYMAIHDFVSLYKKLLA